MEVYVKYPREMNETYPVVDIDILNIFGETCEWAFIRHLFKQWFGITGHNAINCTDVDPSSAWGLT